ncbi:MAG: MaoC family dehydratase [Candidatus Thorarchaeota archaeon]
MVKIGRNIDEFEVGMTAEFNHTFTQKETEIMADLIGDHNPFHYGGEFIRNTRFKRPIVHGLLVGGMISHFGGDLFPGPCCLAETIEFKFLKPVYFGDTIRSVATITEVDRKQKRLAFSMACYNEKGQKVVEGRATCIPYQVEIKRD